MPGRRIDALFYEITARTRGFDRGLDASQRKMRGFVGKLGSATTAFAVFGAAAVAAGIKATRMAANLDRALREVSTLLPGTVDNVSRLRDEVVALSTEIPQTPELLSRGLYQVISAGISDTAEAMDVLRVSARAAVGGLTDTFTTVDAITTVLNAYQLASSEASRVSDVFFTAVREGKLTLENIADNIGTVATSAALAGVSIEEVGAALATMTKFGIDSARAATSLNALFAALTKQTNEQKEAARELGVEFSITALQSKGLVGFLGDLERATGGNVEQLARLIPQIEAQRGVFVLAGQGADEFRRVLDETTDAAGRSDEAFGKMNGSLDNQAQLLTNKINAAWLNLGETILPGVLTALEAINRLLESDAETLARAFERLGLTQEAAAIIVAENRRKIAADLSATAGDIRRSIEEIVTTGEGLRPLFGAATPLGQLPAGQLDQLFPEELESSLNQGARAQREILEATIEHGRELASTIDLSTEFGRRQAQQLADELLRREKIVGQLDQQIARQREFLDLAGTRGAAGDADPEPPDPTPTITGAERTALDLRDALLAADEALREIGASGADIFSEVPNVIAELQGRLDEMAEDAGLTFEEMNAATELAQTRTALERVIQSSDRFGDKALAISGILTEWGGAIDDLPPGLQQALAPFLRVEGAADDTSRSVREIINDVSFAARGAIELANAFGIAGDEASRVVNEVALIGEGIGRIASGDILAGVGGIVSGVAGLLGSGPSQAEIERIQSLEDNTRRLAELSERLELLSGALRTLPSGIASDLESALPGIIDLLEFAVPRGQLGPVEGRQAVEEFERAGVSVSDLQRAADLFEIDVDQLINLLEGDISDENIAEALEQARSLSEVLGTDLAAALDSVSARLGFLRDSFDVLDIDDPRQQLGLYADELDRIRRETLAAGKAFALTADDIERIRAGDESFIEELFQQATTGTGRFTDIDLGDELSFDDFLAILREVEGIQDRIADSLEDGGGDFQNVSAINRATSEQFDRGLALDGTRNFYLGEIRDQLRDGIPVIVVTDSMLAAAATVRHEFTGRMDVTVTGDAVSVESAAVIRDGLVDALSFDRDLGESLRRERAGLGLPPTRTQ